MPTNNTKQMVLRATKENAIKNLIDFLKAADIQSYSFIELKKSHKEDWFSFGITYKEKDFSLKLPGYPLKEQDSSDYPLKELPELYYVYVNDTFLHWDIALKTLKNFINNNEN